MPNIDLSTLRGPELRSLLDSARARGQATLSYEILQEMAARRERGERDGPRALFKGRRAAEPRMIELALGDPLKPEAELEDEPGYEPPSWDDPEAPATPADEATFLESHRPPPPNPVPRRWPWAGGGLAVGLIVGLALGGWATEITRDRRPPPSASASAAAAAAAETTTLASATPAPAPPAAAPPPVAPIPAAAEPAPDAPAEAVAAPAAADLGKTAPSSPEAAEASQDSAATPPAPVQAPQDRSAAATRPAAEGARPTSARPKGCASAPTPADQAICGDPRLQRLQRRLRQAYAEALEAHQDRDLLRQHQLAWRDERSAVADPDRLARLYEARIRKLNAATAAALAQR